jgi:chromosome segregation ATPase
MAFKITSCSFIIRSDSAAEIASLRSGSKRLRPAFQKRTDTVLIQPDISRANDTLTKLRLKVVRSDGILIELCETQR